MLISKLPNGTHVISAKVCDSLNTCTFRNTTAVVTPLESEKIVEIGKNLENYINL